jgi:hypothetical protein
MGQGIEGAENVKDRKKARSVRQNRLKKGKMLFINMS